MKLTICFFFLSLLLHSSLCFSQRKELWNREKHLVRCYTTASSEPFEIELHRSWSPLGVDHYLALVHDGYYDNSPIFRVVPNFLTQFGMSMDREKENKWKDVRILDEAPEQHHTFKRGTFSFAGAGSNSRTTQVFISHGDNPHLGKALHETPIGEVVKGMDVVDKFFDGNGKFSMDMPPWGQGPEQHRLRNEGRQYIENNFPDLTFINKCEEVVPTREDVEERRKDDKEKRREKDREQTHEWKEREKLRKERKERRDERRALKEDRKKEHLERMEFKTQAYRELREGKSIEEVFSDMKERRKNKSHREGTEDLHTQVEQKMKEKYPHLDESSQEYTEKYLEVKKEIRKEMVWNWKKYHKKNEL